MSERVFSNQASGATELDVAHVDSDAGGSHVIDDQVAGQLLQVDARSSLGGDDTDGGIDGVIVASGSTLPRSAVPIEPLRAIMRRSVALTLFRARCHRRCSALH